MTEIFNTMLLRLVHSVSAQNFDKNGTIEVSFSETKPLCMYAKSRVQNRLFIIIIPRWAKKAIFMFYAFLIED